MCGAAVVVVFFWKKRCSENVYCNNWPFNFDDDYGSITAIQSFPELTAAK